MGVVVAWRGTQRRSILHMLGVLPEMLPSSAQCCAGPQGLRRQTQRKRRTRGRCQTACC
jgi:hypothetical protein